MSEVITFPNKSPKATAAPSAEAAREAAEERERRKRDYDVFYARDAMKAALTAEALQHISGTDPLLIASTAVSAIDTARHERQYNSEYDRHRIGSELSDLDQMYMGGTQPAAPELPSAGRPGLEGPA